MEDQHQGFRTVQENVIYMSGCRSSLPHKMYTSMREEYWRHHQWNSRKTVAGGRNRNQSSRWRETDSSSMSTPTAVTEESVAVNYYTIDRSENNKTKNEELSSKSNDQVPKFSRQEIPLSVDMSTQLNEDMKFILEKDSKDDDLVKIQFGGTFGGSISGSGKMPYRKLLNMVNEKVADKVIEEISRTKLESQVIEEGELETNKPSNVSTKKLSKLSLGSEEAIDHFASTTPTEPAIVKQVSQMNNIDVQSDKVSKTESIRMKPIPMPIRSVTNTSGNLKHMITDNNDTPAVLPKCIIRRIIQSMITDLEIPLKAVKQQSPVEDKVPMLTSDPDVLKLNWHAAVKRARVMIAEIVEMILSVNIDSQVNNYDEIIQILQELNSELTKSCIFIFATVPKRQLLHNVCLELIMEIITYDINRLREFISVWFNSDRQNDIGSFFMEHFNRSLSTSQTEQSSTNQEAVSRISTKILPETALKIQNANGEVKQTGKSKGETPTNGEGSEVRSRLESEIQNWPPKRETERSEGNIKIVSKTDSVHSQISLSLITTSRVKKTMGIIKEKAVKYNVQNLLVNKSIRNEMFPLVTVDKKPLINKMDSRNLLEVAKQLNTGWIEPILSGQISIRDLLEFIITSTSQEKLVNNELYAEILGELNSLEKELLASCSFKLQDSRNSDNDFESFCYELLVEIILEEVGVAKYMFKTLNTGNNEVNSALLGKLYRNFIEESENTRMHENTENSPQEPSNPSANVAHLTSEIMNYSETENAVSIKEATEPKLKSKLDSFLISPSKTESLKKTFSEIEKEDAANVSKMPSMTRDIDNEILLMIINKLNQQTDDINDVKKSIVGLKGIVEEKFSNFTCGFSMSKIDQYCSLSEAPGQNNTTKELSFAKAGTIFNAQEIIGTDEKDKLASANPVVSDSISQRDQHATTMEIRSFVAPMSRSGIETEVHHQVDHSAVAAQTGGLTDADVLRLVADGAHTMLQAQRLKQSTTGSAQPPSNIRTASADSKMYQNNLQRLDSCTEINREFEHIFRWVVERYADLHDAMAEQPTTQQFIQRLNAASTPPDDRRAMERQLIDRIVDENNFVLHQWVKDICIRRVINCFSALS